MKPVVLPLAERVLNTLFHNPYLAITAQAVTALLNKSKHGKVESEAVLAALDKFVGDGVAIACRTAKGKPAYRIQNVMPGRTRSRRVRKAPSSGQKAGPVIYRQLKWTQDTL